MTRIRHRPLLTCSMVAACSHAGAGTGHGLLARVADVPLPGRATRLDYQEIDAARGQLVIAHMRDDAVVIVDLADGTVKKRLTGIPTPRGVAIADDLGVIFVTSTPDHVVLIDRTSLAEITRVGTGAGPDGIAWDRDDQIVGVSDQRDGALSLIAGGGRGARTQVALGAETGNVLYDGGRRRFWITVVRDDAPDALIAIDPRTAAIATTIELPGCHGAHGLRLHPDGHSAYIACEDNSVLARVELDGAHAIATGATGRDPDVLSVDAGQGWLYVAAESGDLTIFDLRQPGVALIGHDHPGPHSHTVVADPATHRVFFPLQEGPGGKPVLRIMRPRD